MVGKDREHVIQRRQEWGSGWDEEKGRRGGDEDVAGLVILQVESVYNVPRHQRISECKSSTAYPCDFVCGGRGGWWSAVKDERDPAENAHSNARDSQSCSLHHTSRKSNVHNFALLALKHM